MQMLMCKIESISRKASSVQVLQLERDISESKLCIEFSAGEKYRRKVIGIRAVWNIYSINGCIFRIFSVLDYHNLDVKITVLWNGNTLPLAKRRCRTYTWAGACHGFHLGITMLNFRFLWASGARFPRSPSSSLVDSLLLVAHTGAEDKGSGPIYTFIE